MRKDRYLFLSLIIIACFITNQSNFNCFQKSNLKIFDYYPSGNSFRVPTQDLIVKIQFSNSLNPDSIKENSLYIKEVKSGKLIYGNKEITKTLFQNDTLLLKLSEKLIFGEKYQLVISNEIQDLEGNNFDGNLPEGDIFVANIPNDFNDDPLNLHAMSYVGYNPYDPEKTNPNHPLEIPGIGITEVWKYTQGNPDVIIALIDVGIKNYGGKYNGKNFFLNRYELSKPNWNGKNCPSNLDPYDCNGDGIFNIEDYLYDSRVYDINEDGLDPLDLILNKSFANGIDDDNNGYIDDISGYDFFRNVPESLGTRNIPSGMHGDDMYKFMVEIADDGYDAGGNGVPGVCPKCRVLPIRVGESIIIDVNKFEEALRYAASMGAKVAVSANATINFTKSSEKILKEASDLGLFLIAASGDEFSFHRNFPAAFQDAFAIKSLLPITGTYIESACTNWGPHILVSVSSPVCTSYAVAITGGLVGLLYSRAMELNISLSSDEIKQILTMTADDISYSCITFASGKCQVGWESSFGYGRVNAVKAIKSLGDNENGIRSTIPPSVKILKPTWNELIDPLTSPMFDIIGKISARGRPFYYSIQYAKGINPQNFEFKTLHSAYRNQPIDGIIKTINLLDLVKADEMLKTPQFSPFDHSYTIKITAYYNQEDQKIYGEDRVLIYLHSDNDPSFGLISGFPIEIDASIESSPVIIDIDGDNIPEILFGTSDGKVYAFHLDKENEKWVVKEGFPVTLIDPNTKKAEPIFASLAVSDLFKTGELTIIAANFYGSLFAIYPQGTLKEGGPFLKGFPVGAALPNNNDPSTYGHGIGFWSSPVLVDLDKDGILEIVIGGKDQKVYAWHPYDYDNDNKADPVSGWPVLVKSDERVGDKFCKNNYEIDQIFTTPTYGILDPNSSDKDIRDYPAIIITTTELCDDIEDDYEENDSTRIYAIYHNGNDNPKGPFVEGWPVNPKSLILADSLNLIPPISSGATTNPAFVTVNEKSYIFGGNFLGFPYIIYYHEGVPEVKEIQSLGNLSASANGSIGYLDSSKRLFYTLGTAGVAGYYDGITIYRNDLQLWDISNPEQIEAPLRTFSVEDMQFMMNPVIADIDGDKYSEIINGTGGYVLHAFNVNGREPRTWPKLVNQWVLASPAVADIDNDNLLEVVVVTREGKIFAWNTEGPSCVNGEKTSSWPRFHHDIRNSGNFNIDADPPSRILDLSVKKVSENNYKIYFSTSGDDGFCGKAKYYLIKYSSDSNIDLSNPEEFKNAKYFMKVEGIKDDKASIIIRFPDEAKAIAIMAQDDSGNLSYPSNMAILEE